MSDWRDGTFYGEGGNDHIDVHDGVADGGTGDDYLTGGTGSDTFVFSPGDSGAVLGTRDRIADARAASTVSILPPLRVPA